MENQKIQRIYREIDSRMKEANRLKFLKYAKHNNYKSGTECIFELLKTKTAQSILDGMKAIGIRPIPSIANIWNIKYRVDKFILEPSKKDAKICRTEGCTKVVPEDNWWYCKACERNNKRINIDKSFYSVNI